MPYSENLAQRVRDYFGGRDDVSERKMFGGLAFMVAGHMCVGVVDECLMARVGPANYESGLTKAHTRLMDFTGKPLKGFIYVDPAGIATKKALTAWIASCEGFVFSLPPK